MLAESSLEDLQIQLLLQAIQTRYGYHVVDYAENSLRRRVRAVLTRSGLSRPGELQQQILPDPHFFASIVDDLTVRVSDVFRAPPFLCAFREHVVPILRTYPLLNCWHAGRASGDEVYTTAILLCEEKLYDRTHIYFGSQLRERALATFAGCLERSGFLCLGMSEGLSPFSQQAFQDFAERERIYGRRPG